MTIEFTFRSSQRSETDNWNKAGDIISESEKLAAVAKALSDGKLLVLEHRHYRGSRRSDRIVIDDFDDFIAYLKENAVAGDGVYIFDITVALADDKYIIKGKCPDEKGEVPQGGAY